MPGHSPAKSADLLNLFKLSKNSSNSGKPPSSDDITKPKTKNRGNARSEDNQGIRNMNILVFAEEKIDKLHPYILTACPNCNGEVSIV